MSIWFYPYELHPTYTLSKIQPTQVRRGALLRMDDRSGCSGFADCHPLEEFGENSISEQLEFIKNEGSNELLEASFYYAHLDREARRNRVNLFEKLQIPLSHKLILNRSDLKKIAKKPSESGIFEIEKYYAVGFKYFKFKMGFDLEREVTFLNELTRHFSDREIYLRLDFNETLSARDFIEFKSRLTVQSRCHIDFIEDPVPFEASLWKELASTHVKLAVDRAFPSDITKWSEENFTVVYKPARSSYGKWREFLVQSTSRIVTTSSMDHPFGQMSAAFVAAKLSQGPPHKEEVCGLLTHEFFEKCEFIEQIQTDGPRLTPVHGTGFGFDDLLEKLPWKKLV